MTTDQPLQISDNPEQRRYEAYLDGNLAGIVEYGRVPGRIVALHTEVLPEFGGRGIASALVRRVLSDARGAGAKVTPRCPFFAAHFERHPEDADILAPARGRRKKASSEEASEETSS
jgi:predicted GNAT family acetyltransferase